MGILDEDVARVRESTDLVALAGEHIALKRVGNRYMGLCPFHAEKTPSFSVNQELGVWHCLGGDTRVITWDGVRPIRELAGTTQRVLSAKGRWVEAPFHSFGVQPLVKITVGRNRVRKEIFATPEHRWFIRIKNHRRERTSAELRPGDSLSWSFPHQVTSNVRPSPFGVAHGITYGDGSRFARGSCVDLHGEKDAQLLKWFPLSHSYQCEQVEDGKTRSFLKVVDLPAFFKERPSRDESAAYLLGWVAGYFAADGCVDDEGTPILNSSDRSNLEFVRLICHRLGIGTYGITRQMRTGIRQSTPSALYRINFIAEDLNEDFFLLSEHRLRFVRRSKAFHRRGWVVKSVEPTGRAEEVFCAVVPGDHSFALEDNILTGNCFGCQKSGDAITFVREVEHLDFVDAVERLAARAGITLRYDDKSVGKDRKRRDRLAEAVGEAIAFYHRLLLEAPEGGTARRYLRSRGFEGDAVRQFSLGWSPDDWDRLSAHLQSRKFSRDDITGAGLAFVNKVNKLQDQFRARLMFPIYDSRGEPAGFGGRALDDDGPKYKNSPETAIYHKSRLLYGLNWAKGEMVAKGEVVICEGYTDVMAFALAGAPNAVATCGTALADDHFQILKNLARKVTLAYDADAAGRGAAERWYQWEQRYEIELRVAALPPGRDPADVWRDDPGALLKALDGATRFLQFRIDQVLAAADRTSPEGRARAAEALVPVLREHPSELVREGYIQSVAGTLGVDHAWFKEAIARGVRPRREPPPDASRPKPDRPVDRRELDALRGVIHQPQVVADWLEPVLFADPTARAAFEQLRASSTFREALDASDGPVHSLLERLAVEDANADGDIETVRARLIVNMVSPAAERLLKSMVERDDPRASDVKTLLDVVAHNRETGEWDDAQQAARQLVGWLVDRAQE